MQLLNSPKNGFTYFIHSIEAINNNKVSNLTLSLTLKVETCAINKYLFFVKNISELIKIIIFYLKI